MSILKRLIWSRWSFVPTYPSRARFVRTLTRENGDKVRMNAGTHQEKKKMRRRAREKQKKRRKQATNFKAACCPFAVVQGTARQNNGLYG